MGINKFNIYLSDKNMSFPRMREFRDFFRRKKSAINYADILNYSIIKISRLFCLYRITLGIKNHRDRQKWKNLI